VPLRAPLGTVVSMLVLEATVNLAAVTPNSTAVAPVKPVPVMTTEVPTGPVLGVKLVIVGPAAAAGRVEPRRAPATATTVPTVASHRLKCLFIASPQRSRRI
jgi:hypothetical protein